MDDEMGERADAVYRNGVEGYGYYLENESFIIFDNMFHPEERRLHRFDNRCYQCDFRC